MIALKAATDGCAARSFTARPAVAPYRSFTIVELLVVIAVIIVLAALILSISGYVQKKGARSRAEAEIAAISAALESYRADNGIYPTSATYTEGLDPTTSPVPTTASQYLYGELTADRDFDGSTDANGRSYFTFRQQSLQRADMSSPISNSNIVSAIRDPFGNAYGYSTARSAGRTFGYNPTFDLWSTANANPANDQNQWIKNW